MASPASLSSGIPASGSRSPSQASSSTSPALDLDLLPLLDLCPSISTLRALLQVTASQVSDEEKRRRIARALLRAAGSGDVDLLAWLLDARAEGRAWLPSCAHSGVPTTILGVAEGRASQANGIPAIDFAALRDEDGAGPVVLAATFGHVDAVRMLVLAGADVDERDQCGWTPLMWATNSSNLPLVSFLLSHGADLEARSLRGTTCEDFILSSSRETQAESEELSAFAGPSSRPSLGLDGGLGGPKSPHTSDRELIAETFYEYQQVVKERMKRSPLMRAHKHSASTSSLASSSWLPGSPSKVPSSLSMPHPPSPPEGSVNALSSLASPAGSRAHSRTASHGFAGGHSRTSSLATTTRRLLGRSERVQLAEQELRARELAEGRRRALLDTAVMLEVEYGCLVGNAPDVAPELGAPQPAASGRKGKAPSPVHSGLASGCGAVEVGTDPLSADFNWNQVRADQMLVIGMQDLAPLLDMLITNVKPVRAPWTARAAPANVIFLCARYACSFGDEELLEELILGAIDRIEGCIYAHPLDMVHLAFWLFNCTLLLHYVQRDTTLSRSEAIGEYRPLLADLINEIYVFVIRDAERRIDRVLDAAMLDHEAIPGFEEVRFEGEWKFMRALAGSVKGMRDGGASPSPGRRPISQIFGGARDNIPEPGSSPNGAGFGPGHVSHAPPGSPFRVAGDVSPPKSRPSSLINARDTLHNSSPATLLSRPSPRTITSLLTSTLHVLQLYEINPAIVIQALSQVFFWVGCELFNRVLTRRRYLCRSRAMQIRMNVSALEDWARSNALPLAVVNAHLAPLSQLVSWLQCQSALCEFDGLIATMQGLRALNPPQMRRAVHDYRYEVGEGRMSAECIQYLEQLQKDWERRRVDLSISMVEREREHELEVRRHEASRHGVNAGKKKGQSAHHRSGTATQDGSTPDSRSPSPSEDEQENDQHPRDGDWDQDTSVESAATAGAAEEGPGSAVDAAARAAQGSIDALFEAGRSMADYIPPWTAAGGPPGVHGEVAAPAGPVGASETPLGELLNSRDMLPFALPSRTEALVVSPGDAFGFGRGHFTGTGTPSLKSVRAPSPSPFGGASPTFGSRASSPASGSEGGDNASDDGAGSVSGASSRTGASAASRSSLFPDGHGFAAGASWQPVPVLPEGLLEGIDKLMRDVPVNARTPLESRLTAVLSPELERFPSSASSIATSTTRGAGAGASNQGDDHQRDRDRDRRFEKTGNLSPVPPTPDLDGWSETGAESPRPSMGEEEEDAEAAEDVSNLEEVDLGSDLGSPAPESSSMRSASGEYGYGGREIQRGRQGQRIQQGHHARRASGLSGVPARLFLPEGDGVTGNERRLASRMAALSVNASSTAGLGAGVEEEDEGVFTPRGERRMEF